MRPAMAAQELVFPRHEQVALAQLFQFFSKPENVKLQNERHSFPLFSLLTYQDAASQAKHMHMVCWFCSVVLQFSFLLLFFFFATILIVGFPTSFSSFLSSTQTKQNRNKTELALLPPLRWNSQTQNREK
jgi:hypothetical protein